MIFVAGLRQRAGQVAGLLLTSDRLPEHWTRLDEFEGAGYERVLTTATLNDGRTVEAYVYRLTAHGAS